MESRYLKRSPFRPTIGLNSYAGFTGQLGAVCETKNLSVFLSYSSFEAGAMDRDEEFRVVPPKPDSIKEFAERSLGTFAVWLLLWCRRAYNIPGIKERGAVIPEDV